MGKRKTTEQFIEDAYCKHGDRYNYKLVDYKNWDGLVNIICPIHGIFEQKASIHLMGSGCKKCGSMNTATPKTTEQFIEDAYCKHGDRYNYKLVDYKNNKTKVKIICHKHGIFEQNTGAHLRGQNCKKCVSNEITSNDFIKNAIIVHNNEYDYSLVEYKNNKTKVKIICHKHGIFEQRPDNHIQSQHCPKCTGKTSKAEQELQEWLSQYIDIKTNDRTIINPLELDIVIPSKRIAIEYNGLYWHSEQQGKDKQYHKNKMIGCNDVGYRLIHIFEDEWLNKKDIVKSRLKHILGIRDRVVFARKCHIKEIEPSVAGEFINTHHIQGYTGSKVKLGLFHETKDDFGFPVDELLAVMTFAVPSISKGNKTQKDVYELSRYCSSCAVTGGAGKLLKYFIRNYKVNGLFTYADLRWSDGNLYKALGFSNERLTPVNYYYIVDGIRKHRFNYRKNVLKDKLNTFNPTITEYQNMLNNGYDRIWDCGNLRYDYII